MGSPSNVYNWAFKGESGNKTTSFLFPVSSGQLLLFSHFYHFVVRVIQSLVISKSSHTKQCSSGRCVVIVVLSKLCVIKKRPIYVMVKCVFWMLGIL